MSAALLKGIGRDRRQPFQPGITQQTHDVHYEKHLGQPSKTRSRPQAVPILRLALTALAFLLAHTAAAAPLSGTKTIGPTGDYASIGAAIVDIQAQTLGGALVLELQAGYLGSVETFPLVFASLGTTAANTVTLRPELGATGLSLSSADTTAATVDLRGAQFLTLDGRPGGVGAVSELSIANNHVAGVALRFINEASGNTVRYLALRGVNTNVTSGVVVFSTTTGANGNDGNTLDHCDIGDGASTPAHGLYALGTTTTAAQNNSGNTVSSCNVFNFYAATALDAAGVRLDGGNTGWTLTGNSFYQTASRAAVAASVRAIYLNNPSGENFTVTGNFIGGSAASAGGTAWTTTGTAAAYRFVGLQLNISNSAPSSLQGNTIQNIVWTSSTTGALPGAWNGIYVQAGTVNIGTASSNAIGSGTGTGSVSVTTSTPGSGSTTYGIVSTSLGTVAIVNNVIGSITVNGTATTISSSITGIRVTAGTNTISGNIVGSTTTANSLNAATPATGGGGPQVVGILSTSTTSASITGNTVANLNNNYVGTAGGRVHGIVTSAGANIITGNTVRNLSTPSANAVGSSSQAVLGISQSSTSAGQIVSQNVVHSLANTAASAAVSVTGIYFAGTIGDANVIARNLVHSLAVSSTSASAAVNGIQFASGTFTAQNNMVRVGLDALGNPTAGASIVRGIQDAGTDSGRNFYHNSVYVGGTQTSGAASTFAFTSTGTANARAYQNNIFVNARSNSGGTGKHYAVSYGGTTVNPAGLTAGGNIFHVSGTGGVLGLYNSADHATLAAWQAATGQDVTSAAVDPLFVNATGDATTGDQHLQASNPAESGGLVLVAVTDDFDGQTRSALTPADIGADAGNFTLTGDFFAPAISYPLLTPDTVGNRTLTGFATITDNAGVAGGASAPRFYFKKSTDADAFVGNTAADNGWKFVPAANGSSPFSFTIDYSLLNGGGVTAGDTIQYFVVAQDAVDNLVSSPAGAAAASNPPVPNVNAHGATNSYSIFHTLSGTKTVGTGGDYPSLTGAGGLFAAINGSVVADHLVISITSDLTEAGLNGLNQWLEEGAGNYTLTIHPDSATMKTISGPLDGGLIRLNGADRVTIDGRFGGTGRYLTFYNWNDLTSASTLLLLNDACHNTVRSCLVNGHAPNYALGVIGLSTGAVTGNDHNLITDNQVSTPGASQLFASTLIGSTGSSAAVANSSNTIANNELFNFKSHGVFIESTGNDSWTVSGNNIYETATQTFSLYGITMRASGTNAISDNSIHDLLTTGSASITGIDYYGSSTTTISRNRITINTASAGTIVTGISASGIAGSTLDVVNNQISAATANNATIYGLRDVGNAGSVVNVFYNTIVIGGTASGGNNSWASQRYDASTHTSRNNIFLNFRTGGTGSHFAAGREASGGSYTANDNVYAGTGAGATPGNFMDFSATPGTTIPVNFSTWQASISGDASSQASNPGGNFSTNMFVSAATGDLHLVPGGNPLVNATGNPIAGITTDYDAELRSATTPNIGSDEPAAAAAPDLAVAQTSALTDGVSSVDFGPVTVTSGSAARTFTITNTGTADLTSLAIGTDGANPGDFTFSALGSTTVTPGSTTTFTVTFTPSGVGPRNAALHLANNVSGAKNPFDIALTGTGLSANSAPSVANAIPAQAGAYGAAFQFTFAPDVFTDPDAGQSLTYTATNQPPGVGFDAASRTFSGTNEAAGLFLVSVIATDNGVPPRSGTNTFELTVTKAPLTVTANNTNRPYGEANPAFTGALIGLLNLDNITATFGTPTTPASPPGTYLIAPALADPDTRLGHYTITTNLGTLTIQEVRLESSLDGTIATLYWSTGAVNLPLECTASLEAPIIWQAVTNGITITPTNISYTVLPVTVPPSRFYRLRLP